MTKKLKSAFISNETLLVTSKAGFHWSSSGCLNSADFQFIDPVKKYTFMESISPFFVTILKREQSMKKTNCSLWEQNLLFKSKHPLLVPINILM